MQLKVKLSEKARLDSEIQQQETNLGILRKRKIMLEQIEAMLEENDAVEIFQSIASACDPYVTGKVGSAQGTYLYQIQQAALAAAESVKDLRRAD